MSGEFGELPGESLTPGESVNTRRYYIKRKIFILFTAALMIWGICLLAFWGFWFKMYNHPCHIDNYEIEKRQRCPWSNECYDVQCAYVDVTYFESDGKTHPSRVPVWYYSDSDSFACSKKSREWVMQDLSRRYPIGTNETCYATYERHMGQTVWFQNMNAEEMIFWSSVACFIVAPIVGCIGFASLWIHKNKYPAQYSPLQWS